MQRGLPTSEPPASLFSWPTFQEAFCMPSTLLDAEDAKMTEDTGFTLQKHSEQGEGSMEANTAMPPSTLAAPVRFLAPPL